MHFEINLFIFFATILSVNAYLECCPGNNTLGKGRCLDGRKVIKLDCNSSYLMNPNSDSYDDFGIDDNDYLIYKTYDAIPPNKYCISHLPEEKKQVALVCFIKTNEEKFYVARAIVTSISVIFLALTISVYILVPNLRDLQGKCTLNSIVSLCISFLILSLLQFSNNLSETLCKTSAFALYVFFLLAFFWLNVVSFNIWRTVVKPDLWCTEQQWYKIYCAYAIGIPLIFLLAAQITHNLQGEHLKPGFGVNSCWFVGSKETWVFFYGPISILIIMNIIFFVWTSIDLRTINKNTNPRKVKLMEYKFWLYLKLFFIMGITWSFELLSFLLADIHRTLDYFWSITDYFNALQGFFIFLILVILRKKALAGLANINFCGFRFPKSWKTYQDEEECLDRAEEETRLSNENNTVV